MKFMLFGLGNIGSEYDFTRHNAGFLVIDKLAQRHQAKFVIDKYAAISSISLKGKTVYLVKPTTYMNLSGSAVRYWLQAHKVEVSNSLVITDDYSIPYGSLRMRAKGTHGGHNGLRDIQDKLLTPEYPRLRFGIGDNFPKGAMVPYVLGRFSLTEMEQLPLIQEQAADFCESFILEGMAIAMNKFNK